MFKYMPLRKEFFEDPLLRLTPAMELNDVFELQPTGEVRDEVEYLQSIGVWNRSRAIDSGFVAHINPDEPFHLSGVGVISLTKNPYNILMWSHYADQHKGIVVGFGPVIDHKSPIDLMGNVKKDINNQLRQFGFHPLSAYQRYDDKLKDESRVGFSHLYYPFAADVLYENIRPGSTVDYGSWGYTEALIQRIQTTKSEHWSYEAERRIISPMRFADVVVIKININRFERCVRGNFVDFERDFLRATNAIDQLSKASKVVFCQRGPLSYVVERASRDVECEMVSAVLFEYIKNKNSFGEFFDLMMFKRCQPNAISSVFFGARVGHKERFDALLALKNNPKIKHKDIFLYQAVPSQSRFEIEFKRIGPDELPWDVDETIDDESEFDNSHIRYF